jgi:hypothetical protein
MPITQDRLHKLIELYDLNIARVETLKNQADSIYSTIEQAKQDNDINYMYETIQSLRRYIENVTTFRREEYDAFKEEKVRLELNARQNFRAKEAMHRLRMRRKDATQPQDLGTSHVRSNKIEDVAAILFDKMIEFWEEGDDALTTENLAWSIDQSEGYMNNHILPYMIERGMIVQVEGGYIPKKVTP